VHEPIDFLLAVGYVLGEVLRQEEHRREVDNFGFGGELDTRNQGFQFRCEVGSLGSQLIGRFALPTFFVLAVFLEQLLLLPLPLRVVFSALEFAG